MASREDVASAPGTYRIGKWLDVPAAGSTEENDGQIRISPGERCLVCLEEYQPTEEVRRLAHCSHLFHRECIDQVSACEPSLNDPSLTCFSSGLPPDGTPAPCVETKVWMRRKVPWLNSHVKRSSQGRLRWGHLKTRESPWLPYVFAIQKDSVAHEALFSHSRNVIRASPITLGICKMSSYSRS